MPNTYKKIASVVVGSGGSSSISFTSIPQTYTDLKIVISGRTTYNGPTGQYISFNNSTENFTGRYLFSDNTTPASGVLSRYVGTISGSATASVFNSTEIYITNYASSNNKSFSVENVSENNATYGGMNLITGLWSNSNAITSISIAPDNGSYPQHSTATLYGIGDVTASKFAKATGGLITYDSTYVYHTFTSSGIFTPNTALTADYLVVAGGGGGGGSQGGGGGAGGLRCTVGATGGGGTLESALSLTATAYTVTVGAGGNGGTSAGSNGSNSVFGSITSTGGGGGGYYGSPNGFAGSSGGSGGGGGNAESGTAGAGGAGTSNQGYAGGAGGVRSGTYPTSGGGGGAGAVGQAGAQSADSADGGIGVATTISGLSTYYAGGGGGWISNVPYTGAGIGGTGGGGNGGNTSGATAGTANTGGGGGGINGTTGGAGGSGIVIVRYLR
jgi:hypothetical protein